MHQTTLALNSNQIGGIGIGSIVGVLIIGVIISALITKLIIKAVVLVVAIALAFVVYQQRTTIENHVKKCQLNMTFFGVKVNAPSDVVAQCRNVSKSS